jgi:hypothetical protein
MFMCYRNKKYIHNNQFIERFMQVRIIRLKRVFNETLIHRQIPIIKKNKIISEKYNLFLFVAFVP